MTLDELEALDATGQIAMLTPERRRSFLVWCEDANIPLDAEHVSAALETWLLWWSERSDSN